MKSDPHFNVMPVGRKMRYIFFLFFLPSVLQPLAFVCVCVSSFFFFAQGFRGQSFDFHGVAGKMYHLLSDYPTYRPHNQTPFSINAQFGQAYTTGEWATQSLACDAVVCCHHVVS